MTSTIVIQRSIAQDTVKCQDVEYLKAERLLHSLDRWCPIKGGWTVDKAMKGSQQGDFLGQITRHASDNHYIYFTLNVLVKKQATVKIIDKSIGQSLLKAC